jgi:hypothetical protein
MKNLVDIARIYEFIAANLFIDLDKIRTDINIHLDKNRLHFWIIEGYHYRETTFLDTKYEIKYAICGRLDWDNFWDEEVTLYSCNNYQRYDDDLQFWRMTEEADFGDLSNAMKEVILDKFGIEEFVLDEELFFHIQNMRALDKILDENLEQTVHEYFNHIDDRLINLVEGCRNLLDIRNAFHKFDYDLFDNLNDGRTEPLPNILPQFSGYQSSLIRAFADTISCIELDDELLKYKLGEIHMLVGKHSEHGVRVQFITENQLKSGPGECFGCVDFGTIASCFDGSEVARDVRDFISWKESQYDDYSENL